MENKTPLNHLHDDLHKLHEGWQEMLRERFLLEDADFLAKFATCVKNLDADLSKTEKDPKFGEASKLIEHLIRTPWGAPFVYDTPLVDAARKYEVGQANSKLKGLLEQFISYHDEIEEQLFQCLEEIEKRLEA
ncbi:MAG: hypothetical protein MRY21_03795 [Simkaniaceae bacterium]|nr:hypothetical protein [Simkaniaceae bacterium]